MKIQQYKIERVAISSIDWELPTETLYLFETFVRRSISVKPVWTTVNMELYDKPEEVSYLIVTLVSQSHEIKIESINIQVNEIERLYNSNDNYLKNSIVRLLIDQPDTYYKRTKERFDEDFASCLLKIQNNI